MNIVKVAFSNLRAGTTLLTRAQQDLARAFLQLSFYLSIKDTKMLATIENKNKLKNDWQGGG